MKVRILSDLHMELHPFKLIINKVADVCILAGDIGNPYNVDYDDLLLQLSLTHEKVFVIAGNHEYYHQNIEVVDDYIDALCNQYDNVHYLQKSVFIYKGIQFIGCTLWSHITDPTLCKYMNDFCKININDKKLTFDDYNHIHLEHQQWLEQALQSNGVKICITHHLPLTSLIHDMYKDNPLNSFYASDMTITGANYWVYGHTHHVNHTIIDGIEFHCNPRGYKDEASGFNMNYIFELV